MKKSKLDLTKLFAFCAMILAAIIWILLVLNINWGILHILHFIKDAALLIAIALPAHDFAKKLGKAWEIIYFIILILLIVSLILGVSEIHL
jgi:hypothetical protein